MNLSYSAILWVLGFGAQLLILISGRRWLERRGLHVGTTLRLSTLLLLAAFLLYMFFLAFQKDLEQDATILWLGICGLSALVGLGDSKYLKRIPSILELLIAVVLAFEVIVSYVAITIGIQGVATQSFRILVPMPAAILLCTCFGYSLGYLLFDSQGRESKLGYESFIGRRFLLSKSSIVLSVVTTMSVLGVALGVWLVIMSLGILSGFEDDLRQKFIGAHAHISLQKRDGMPFNVSTAPLQKLGRIDNVLGWTPFIEGEVALSSSSNYSAGGILFGIDPFRSADILTVLKKITKGSLTPLLEDAKPLVKLSHTDKIDLRETNFAPPTPIPHIVIGREMAKSLNVSVGDKIRIISPLLETMTPFGMIPRSLDFRIAAIFSSQMYEFDARYTYIALTAARRFFKMETDAISGVQMRIRYPNKTEPVARQVLNKLHSFFPQSSSQFEALDWKSRNHALFAALKLERVVAFVLLAFIILVASFSIVSTLTMAVIEKQKEISILKTMGARDKGVIKIFLVQGMLVGFFGTFIGAVAALLTAWALQQFGFWIPGDVYYIDALPVHVSVRDVVLVVLAALLIVWDFSVFPALNGARIKPVEGLRDG